LTIGLLQSAQCLDAGDTAGGGIDEGLKAGERLPVDHVASLVKVLFLDAWSPDRHTGLNPSIERFIPEILQECSQIVAI
jgi:hypothetical protein